MIFYITIIRLVIRPNNTFHIRENHFRDKIFINFSLTFVIDNVSVEFVSRTSIVDMSL